MYVSHPGLAMSYMVGKFDLYLGTEPALGSPFASLTIAPMMTPQ